MENDSLSDIVHYSTATKYGSKADVTEKQVSGVPHKPDL